MPYVMQINGKVRNYFKTYEISLKCFIFLQKNKTKMTPNQRNILRRINQSRIPESEIQKYWAAYMNIVSLTLNCIINP